MIRTPPRHSEPGHALSFDDFQSCQIQHRSQHSYRTAPAWTFNDKLVRKVIAAQIATVAGLDSAPENLEALRKVSDSAIAKLKASPSKEHRTLAAAAGRIGLAAYFAAMVYMTYRSGSDSVAVATQLGVSPTGIRQTLHRLRRTAARIGVE